MIENLIKVLVIEDAETDQELIRRQILKAAPSSVFTFVRDEQEFQKKVEWGMPDIVVSDYHLPGNFTGLDALIFLKEKYEHIPFILISGALNDDEKIAEIMTNGADAFMLKDNLRQLPVTFEKVFTKNEIKIAAQKASLARINRNKILIQKISSLLANSPDFEGKDEINTAFAEMEGLFFENNPELR